MKKAVLYLSLLIALTLSSCTAPDDVDETSEIPDVAAEVINSEEMRGKYGVYTDYSGLTGYNTDWEVKSYYFDEPLDEFIPDEGYGRILPYLGEVLYDVDGEVMFQRYGLCTERGEIITKPIYSDVYSLMYYSDNGIFYDDGIFSEMISISKITESGSTTKYAVAAADGSWVTDFIYDQVYSVSGYAVAYIYNEQGYTTIKIAPDGSEVQPNDPNYNTWDIYEGYGISWVEETNQCYFVNESGERVFGPFESASNFSEGLAAVKDENGWRYIDKSGNTVIDVDSKYSYCTDFSDGYASLHGVEGNGVLIDKRGNVVFDKALYYESNGFWYGTNEDFSYNYYDVEAGFEKITYDGASEIHYTRLDRYFYAQFEGGVILFEYGAGNSNDVYIEGNELQIYKLNDNYLNVHEFKDETAYYSVIDLEGNFLFPFYEAYDGFIRFESDGAIIFFDGAELKTSDNRVLLKNCVSAKDMAGTDYIMVQDKTSAGYITPDGEWILRVSLLDSLPD